MILKIVGLEHNALVMDIRTEQTDPVASFNKSVISQDFTAVCL